MTLKCGHDFHNSCLIKYIKTQRQNESIETNQQSPQQID